jgi:hypothetical protein
MPVEIRFCDGLRADDAGRAGPVVDDDLPAEPFGSTLDR